MQWFPGTLARHSLTAFIFLSTVTAASASTASPLPDQGVTRTAPSANCMDARGLREMNQVSPDTLSVRAADQSTWRITFADACPNVLASPHPQVLAKEGWVCGNGDERVVTDTAHCRVQSVAPISSKEFAWEARQNDRDGLQTLATVNVTERKRTLRGSPSYCFNTRHVRGYGDNAKGFTVQTNPKRSGGFSEYVVEVGATCRGLLHSPEIHFRSGFGTSMICGHPGDTVVLHQPEEFHNRRSMLSVDRCEVLAVYPVAP